jgi:iron(III) transport system substrate-binding protein
MKDKDLRLSLVVAACLAIIGLKGAPVEAAPQTRDEIANYKGADRQAVLEAGARKEGVVLAYGSGAQVDPLNVAFMKLYPFVRVEFFHGAGPDIPRRVTEEYKVGRYLVDAFNAGGGTISAIRDGGFLHPFHSPELAALRPEGIESGPKGPISATNYESYVSLGFNTKLVPEAEAPRTYQDLLDPKWQGKMGVAQSQVSNWIGTALFDQGEDFVRKMATQKVKIFNISGQAGANLVVSGELPLSPATFDSHMINAEKKGASVSWRPIGGVYGTIGGTGLAREAPHPHAAMLYIDFLISKTGQEMYREQGYSSARADIQSTKQRPAKVYYLGSRPTYPEEYEKWLALGKQVFTGN